jgi:hypothetical protein
MQFINLLIKEFRPQLMPKGGLKALENEHYQRGKDEDDAVFMT